MTDKCEKAIYKIAKERFGDHLKQKHIKKYIANVKSRAKTLMNGNPSISEPEAYRVIATEMKTERRLAAEKYHQQALRTAKVVGEMISRMESSKKSWAKVLLEGTNLIGPAQGVEVGNLQTGLIDNLEKEGKLVFRAAQSAQFEVEINQMIMDKKFNDTPQGKAARIFYEHHETIGERARSYGFDFHELEGFSHRNYHDNDKIYANSLTDTLKVAKGLISREEMREKTKNKWVDFISSKLNWSVSFPELANKKGVIKETDVKKELSKDWDERYNRYNDNPMQENLEKQLKRKVSFANSITGKSRTYHFNNSADDIAYMREFGSGGLWQSVMRNAVATGKKFAVASQFGPNPELAFMSLKKAINKNEKQLSLEKTPKYLKDAERNMRHALNYFSTTPNDSLANITGKIEMLNNITKLGNLLVKVAGMDTAVAQVVEKRAGGATTVQSFKTAGKIIKNFMTKENESDRSLMRALGIFRNNVNMQSLDRWNLMPNQKDGILARLNSIAFKANLVGRWDSRALKFGATAEFSNRLAGWRTRLFKNLPEGTQKHLEIYGITDKEWQLYKKLPQQLSDRRYYLTGDCVFNASKENILDYLKSKNLAKESKTELSDDDFYHWQRVLSSRLTQMTSDYGHHILPHSDFTAQAKIQEELHGSSAIMHAIKHLILQYKTFSINLYSKVVKPIFTTGQTKSQIASQLGMMAGLSVVYNYLAHSLYNAAVGNSPPTVNIFSDNEKEKEKAKENIREWLIPAGGFAFESIYNFAQNPVRTMASFLGPTANTASDTVNFFKEMFKHQDETGVTRARKSKTYALTKLAAGNIPGHNLPYITAVYNLLFKKSLMDAFSPGTYEQHARKAEQQNDSVPFNK